MGSSVTIVGGGVIGYTCALELARAGHSVAVVSADPPERTTSAVAAAIWFPYAAGPADAVGRWGDVSLSVFTGLAGRDDTGVRMRSGLVLHRDEDPDLSWTSSVPDHRPEASDVPGALGATRCTLPVVEMTRYLGWLVDQAHAAGVRTVRRTVRDLGEVDGDGPVVVAAGLGAAGLTGDRDLVPVRGQVVRLANPGLTDWLIDDDNPAGMTYVVPRGADVVCGGTAERGNTDRTPDDATERAILDRARVLVPALRDAPVVSRGVGLRPGRPVVRLDRTDVDGRPMISCYGHGGAGVTLSWGCAVEVAALVRS